MSITINGIPIMEETTQRGVLLHRSHRALVNIGLLEAEVAGMNPELASKVRASVWECISSLRQESASLNRHTEPRRGERLTQELEDRLIRLEGKLWAKEQRHE